MAVAGGLSSLARPRKWAAAGWPVAEVGGQTGKFAHRREVRQSRIFSPRSATFAAPPRSLWLSRRFMVAPPLSPRRPMVTPPLSAVAVVAAPPLSAVAVVAVCRCRGGPEGGKISIGQAPRLPRFIFIFVKEISDVDQK